ncbi:MAG: hypothetical protein ABSB66_12375 [Candidatus Acidiferrales bacterium]|jgi:hypothetical protein
MWSLYNTLQVLGGTGHLPVGFHANAGIRSLFPNVQQNVSISLLKIYIYSTSYQSSSDPDSQITFTANADGAGNWQIQGTMNFVSDCAWEAGFIFGFSDAGAAHGFIATGSYAGGSYNPQQGQPSAPAQFWVQGIDPWIADNWTQLFNLESYFLSAENTNAKKLPDPKEIATNNGFTTLIELIATTSTMINQEPYPTAGGGGSSGGPSGPGGIDWNIPADDGDDG